MYSYDALNRITAAIDNTGEYSVGNITPISYDLNGNILNMQRKRVIDADDSFTYTYDNGNKLMSLSGSITGSFTYDANGNMKTDTRKGIDDITYNHLNLASRIDFGSDRLEYTYDALGNKLRKKKVENGTPTITEYAGNYIYENGDLQFFSTPEGYVEPVNNGTSWKYVYQYVDHLGSVRLSYADNNNDGVITPSTEILQERNYYPGGLAHKGYNGAIIGSENNKKTYQSQEEEKDLGKNTYAYQWRDYDPLTWRMNKVDRFAEKYQSLTPYHFAANNPIFFREIAGDSINVSDLYKKGKDGKYLHKTQIKTFEFFANTKIGKKYLSQFASKGQKIAGVTFGSDGKYHKNKIDLNFGGNPRGQNSGDTGVGTNNNREPDENGRFQITVNTTAELDGYESLLNLTHEIFIHADRDARDIMDNGKADHSIIDKDLMRKESFRRHHYQESRDAEKKSRSKYSKNGYYILLQGNAKYKKYKSEGDVWGSMWIFGY